MQLSVNESQEKLLKRTKISRKLTWLATCKLGIVRGKLWQGERSCSHMYARNPAYTIRSDGLYKYDQGHNENYDSDNDH